MHVIKAGGLRRSASCCGCEQRGERCLRWTITHCSWFFSFVSPPGMVCRVWLVCSCSFTHSHLEAKHTHTQAAAVYKPFCWGKWESSVLPSKPWRQLTVTQRPPSWLRSNLQGRGNSTALQIQTMTHLLFTETYKKGPFLDIIHQLFIDTGQ